MYTDSKHITLDPTLGPGDVDCQYTCNKCKQYAEKGNDWLTACTAHWDYYTHTDRMWFSWAPTIRSKYVAQTYLPSGSRTHDLLASPHLAHTIARCYTGTSNPHAQNKETICNYIHTGSKPILTLSWRGIIGLKANPAIQGSATEHRPVFHYVNTVSKHAINAHTSSDHATNTPSGMLRHGHHQYACNRHTPYVETFILSV